MKIHHTLRKHYGASALLIAGLLICSYAFWQLQKISNLPEAKIKTETVSTTTSVISKTKAISVPQKIEVDTEIKTTTTTTLPATETIPVTIIITGQSYPIEVSPGSTVYTAMESLSESGTIPVAFKNFSGLGYFVDAINGQTSDTIQAKYWIYYINGQKATRGISQVQLNSNDVISWKYENAE